MLKSGMDVSLPVIFEPHVDLKKRVPGAIGSDPHRRYGPVRQHDPGVRVSRRPWDYLILTASNALQARAYEDQLRARQELGLLPQVREALVVPDLEGKRIGSGGSTLACLVEILRRERARHGIDFTGSGAIQQALSALRILIVHAGGDSRRLAGLRAMRQNLRSLAGHA